MIRPLRNYIAVKPLPTDNISEGGIVVPDSFKERGSKAEIVAVGTGTKDRPMRFKKGYICWHIKGAGTEFIENEISYFLMPDNEILGYIEN